MKKIPENVFKALTDPTPIQVREELIYRDTKLAEYAKLKAVFGVEVTNEHEKDILMSGNFDYFKTK